MLTHLDTHIVRHALLKRLDAERGVEVCEIKFGQHADCLSVGVLARIDHAIVTRSRFDLPRSFELSHLHDEIDEIAEQFKAARKNFAENGGAFLAQPEREMSGTGLRGRWVRYG
jgi:hypothetical protein